MTSPDPRRQLRRALSRELRWRPLARRRLLDELTAHLDDSAADLRAAGWPAADAAAEAARRFGDPGMVASEFRSGGSGGRWKTRGRRLRSPAWIAAGAMSLVTAWAAEVPQASGAKTTTSAVRTQRMSRHSGRQLSRRSAPALPDRALR